MKRLHIPIDQIKTTVRPEPVEGRTPLICEKKASFDRLRMNGYVSVVIHNLIRSNWYKMSIYYAILILFLILFPTFTKAASWDLEETLRTYIKDNFPWDEVEIQDIRFSGEMPDESPERIAVEKNPPGKTVFWLKFSDGNEATVTAEVKAFGNVVMNRRALKKGHYLDEGNLYVATMDVTRMPMGTIKDYRGIIGKPLTRSIIANTPIVDDMVEQRTEIKRGHRVILLTNSPGLTITAVGELKEDGYIGEYVRVVNTSSKKIITGMLVDENTVKVEY